MRKLLLGLCVLAFVLGLWSPPNCPAPLVWRKGEGWTYEKSGVTVGKTPAEQLEIAKTYFAKRNYSDALTAYRRLIRRWPTSFAVEEARLGAAACLSAKEYYFKAFKEYQALLDKHPNTKYYDEILQRQFEIANLFYGGQRDKAFGIKWFPAVEKAVTIYEQVVKNGPYSAVGPQAQFRAGLTQEKLKDYLAAVRAYEQVIERYPNQPLAERAQFQIGFAYRSEAKRAEYDQNAANQAIGAFTDFLVRFPQSETAPMAGTYRTDLKEEQSRGLYRIGQYYEKQKAYKSAMIYYSEVIEQNPQSGWAAQAKDKVAQLRPRAAAIDAARPKAAPLPPVRDLPSSEPQSSPQS